VLATVDEVVVTAGLRQEIDGGRPWCQSEPAIYYLLHRVVVGNPRRHADFALDTRSPYLVFPDSDVAVSQTLRTPSTTPGGCDAGVLAADVVYVGSGMATHSLAVLGPLAEGLEPRLPSRLPWFGVLGLGMDPRAEEASPSQRVRDTRGMWARHGTTTGLGWTNASLYLGDADTRGWIMFNSTAAHPYSYAKPASVLVHATPNADLGYLLQERAQIRIGDREWDRAAVLLPESPFIELPEDIFDAAIVPLDVNVHAEHVAAAPWFTALHASVSVTLVGMRLTLDKNALVVSHAVGDVDDVARYFLFRRAPAGTSTIRFGCAPFQLNVFISAASNTTLLQLSLAVVEKVAVMNTFNILMFPVLIGLFIVYMLGAALTDNVMSQEVAEPDHSLLAKLHHGWSMEATEVSGAALSLATVLVNAYSLDLVPRYAFLMDSDLATGVAFSAIARWTIGVLATLHITVVVLEVMVVWLRTRHPRHPRHPRHQKRAALALVNTPSTLLAMAVAPFPTLIAPQHAHVHANTRIIGTLRMWNFHLIVRRICAQSCMLLATAITVLEGPRDGYNIRILAMVVITAFVVPCHMFASLARALWVDVRLRQGGATWAVRAQMGIYTATTAAFMVVIVVYFMEPLSTMVFPVFPASVLWAISALLALFLLGIGVISQIDRSRVRDRDRDRDRNRNRSRNRKRASAGAPADLISTMVL
jgi:hypothetical protein